MDGGKKRVYFCLIKNFYKLSLELSPYSQQSQSLLCPGVCLSFLGASQPTEHVLPTAAESCPHLPCSELPSAAPHPLALALAPELKRTPVPAILINMETLSLLAV